MRQEPLREHDALFVVIIKSADAESLLRAWVKEHRITQVQVSGNRLRIFDHYCLQKFQVTWSGNWSHVMIWDCWNKRHIYHD